MAKEITDEEFQVDFRWIDSIFWTEAGSGAALSTPRFTPEGLQVPSPAWLTLGIGG